MLGWPLAHGFPSSRPSRVCRSICWRERAVPLRTPHAHCTILNDGSATPWRNSEFLWPGFSGRVLDLVPGFNQPDLLKWATLTSGIKIICCIRQFCFRLQEIYSSTFNLLSLLNRFYETWGASSGGTKSLPGSYAIRSGSYTRFEGTIILRNFGDYLLVETA